MQNPQGSEHKSQSDENLVVMAQMGDQAAFSALIERHYATCEKLAWSILRDRQDAEDEVQNASWKAFQHIGQFQRDARFSTWLTRIVVNQCLMRMRKARRWRMLYIEEIAGPDNRVFDLPSPADSPEQSFGRSEIGILLHHEIRRIPPLLRTVFLMRDVNQMPMTDVAEALGISVAAAKSRLLRARSELRHRLDKHLGRIGPATLTA